ncbi:MAG TPA: lipid-A-disaccharide synthase [Cryomorphaceae bacterium]|nr:lipid-A-disaccharide synthase [Cryomorphaceae bacterium]|tara:strand:+ start:1596 stop:2660 length:1065 start_codon:yes stop_codon:yes gene_type:complete
MKVFWIAGEPSGDTQAAVLVRALKDSVPELEQAGWGGTHMAEAGMKQVFDLSGKPLMGFVEVVFKATTILKQVKAVKNDIAAFEPQILILVDYAGFNLRIAKWAQFKGIRVVYFIPPKIWAWKESRLKSLTAYSNVILSILPFEEHWYAARGHEIHYVGNPLLLRYAQERRYQRGSKKVLLLPGSRMQEIKRLMPEFIELAKALPEYRFHVVRAASVRENWPFVELPRNLVLEDRSLEDGAVGSEYALTCSGTASLEIALLGIPQSVVYKANSISLAIARKLIKVDYFSLPNLIMDEPIVPEFLQEQVHLEQLKYLVITGGEDQLPDIARLRERMGTRDLTKDAVPRILAVLKD